jgi:hypothetical protein
MAVRPRERVPFYRQATIGATARVVENLIESYMEDQGGATLATGTMAELRSAPSSVSVPKVEQAFPLTPIEPGLVPLEVLFHQIEPVLSKNSICLRVRQLATKVRCTEESTAGCYDRPCAWQWILFGYF